MFPVVALERKVKRYAVVYLQRLAPQFPGSEWVTAAAALAQYGLRNFDEAQELYEDLLERDPHRIEVFFALAPPAAGCPAITLHLALLFAALVIAVSTVCWHAHSLFVSSYETVVIIMGYMCV